MPTVERDPLYRHSGVALIRAAAVPLASTPYEWPDLADTESCRTWLDAIWAIPAFASAVQHASPGLADRVGLIRADRTVPDKQVRRATASIVRYLLRAVGRPTPFGLFAGVAPVGLGSVARVRWGHGHWPATRVDTQWLAAIIDRLEACPELLERLAVVFNNLATQRGGQLEVPAGSNRVRKQHTSAVRLVRDAAVHPIGFGDLAGKLSDAFPGVGDLKIRDLLTELVQQGFLITSLRAPLTTTDPLGYLIDRLRDAKAETLPQAAPLSSGLEAIRADIQRLNESAGNAQARARAATTRAMRRLAPAGRTQLSMDLRLDCDVHLPEEIAEEMARAADVLLRLTLDPAGDAVWRDYQGRFCDRYGTGTLVPLTDVVDPDGGLGYPASYPGSVLPIPAEGPTERDERLLTLAWRAIADSRHEIVLTEELIASLTGGHFDERSIPPHVEIAARIHAADIDALLRGEYSLTVSPARSAGTLTSRFSPLSTGSGLERAYRAVPTGIDGALPVQLSFPPVYPHAENVSRIPRYLPHVLSLSEHRGPAEEGTVIPLDDLAINATRDRLHLVSVSRRRIIEPQVFHALALEKQPPPLARFLAHLPRAFGPRWHEFDWGPHAHRLPYLPRIRYGRTVICPARWRLTADDLLPHDTGAEEQRQALEQWRIRWHCPSTVELRDADRTLRLTLDIPAHAEILTGYLDRNGSVALTEAGEQAGFGWIGGHVHEVAVPLAAAGPALPSPLTGALPRVTNRAGDIPGAAADWLYAKVFTHPERLDEVIGEHLPRLLAALPDEPAYWFVRYRGPNETDHLRLRIRTPRRDHQAAYVAVVGEWVQELRADGLAGRLIFDTYGPEVGRYGHGPAMRAAEAVFAADSQVVTAALRHLPAAVIDPLALAAVNMVDIVCGFHADLPEAMEWLAAQPAQAMAGIERGVVDQVAGLTARGVAHDLPDWPEPVTVALQARADALASYRACLPAANVAGVLESLLHMHHNRARGIDPDGERICRRLARQAAITWRARNGAGR